MWGKKNPQNLCNHQLQLIVASNKLSKPRILIQKNAEGQDRRMSSKIDSGGTNKSGLSYILLACSNVYPARIEMIKGGKTITFCQGIAEILRFSELEVVGGFHEICQKKTCSSISVPTSKIQWPTILENSPKPHLSPGWSSNSFFSWGQWSFLSSFQVYYHKPRQYITNPGYWNQTCTKMGPIESPHSTTLQDGPLVTNRVVFHPYNWHDICVTGVKQLLKTWS